MRVASIALMGTLVAAPALGQGRASPSPPSPSPSCKPVADQARAPGPAAVKRLGEMPPAQQIRTVWRFDEKGCPVLVVVRSEVGANGR